jgi:hypothetical protein
VRNATRLLRPFKLLKGNKRVMRVFNHMSRAKHECSGLNKGVNHRRLSSSFDEEGAHIILQICNLVY